MDIHLFQNIATFKIHHRYPYEHRLIDGANNKGFMRYMLKGAYKYTEKVSFDIYDEVFLNVKGDRLFSQNWFGAGASYSFSKLIKTRLGFQNIQTEGDDFNRILVGLTFTPDFRKTK